MRNTSVYRVDKKEVLDFLKADFQERVAELREELSYGDMRPMLLNYLIEYLEGQDDRFKSFDGFEHWLQYKQDEEYGQAVAS